jgi:hypothetical protein
MITKSDTAERVDTKRNQDDKIMVEMKNYVKAVLAEHLNSKQVQSFLNDVKQESNFKSSKSPIAMLLSAKKEFKKN